MPRRHTVSTLADLAEDQWGLVTTEQARAAGVAWSTISRLAARDVLQRVARGVYRMRGAAPVEHLELRASWLQLAPQLPAWQRGAEHGVVSHRSAAALYGLGHLPADRHEFIAPSRRQPDGPTCGCITDSLPGPSGSPLMDFLSPVRSESRQIYSPTVKIRLR